MVKFLFGAIILLYGNNLNYRTVQLNIPHGSRDTQPLYRGFLPLAGNRKAAVTGAERGNGGYLIVSTDFSHRVRTKPHYSVLHTLHEEVKRMIASTAIMPKSAQSIMHNTKVKNYPDGISKITVASRKIFIERGWELNQKEFTAAKIPKPQSKNSETRNDSQKRSKDKIYDIIAMNRDSFKYFVTLTFDPDKIDSRSAQDVIRVMRSFLKNMVSRNSLSYIFIPELHKDGKIHLHGITNDCLKLADSGTRKAEGYDKPLKLETLKRKGIRPEDCKTVYNLPQWKYGFSTAEEISGNTDMIFGYVTKYITKDLSKIFGNFYYAGGELVRNVPFELGDTDYDSFECDFETYCEPAKTGFKYLKIQN